MKTRSLHPHITEVMADLTAPLQLRLTDYFTRQAIPLDEIRIVDLVMALLRIGTDEARNVAQELAGCAIRKCPAAIPPWPPKPVQARKTDRRVVRAVANPCRASTDAYRRYAFVKVGMTKDQMKARGITARDLEYWSKKGWLELA